MGKTVDGASVCWKKVGYLRALVKISFHVILGHLQTSSCGVP